VKWLQLFGTNSLWTTRNTMRTADLSTGTTLRSTALDRWRIVLIGKSVPVYAI